MSQATLRVGSLHDAEAIAKIYNFEVENSTATFDLVPRTIDEQREWISARSGAFSVIVADTPVDGVIGFGALSPYRDRAAYRTTVEDSVYVHRDYQGRGIGKLLLSQLIQVAKDSGFHTIIARIDSGGDPSLRLHRALDFIDVGIEREVGRKFGRWLDSVILQRMLP